jgi:two-component system sensor histidine kinase ChiS
MILAKDKGVQLFNEVPENSLITQYRQALGVIVYNLAMNAIKYTETGEIRITAQFTGEGFSLTVTDTGIGISPNMVKQLNSPEPVFTEHSTGEIKKFQFGYLIIKDLLQIAQGTMTVKSTPGKGTEVTIQFK